MLTPSLRQMTQNTIDRFLSNLEKEISNYELQLNLQAQNERLRRRSRRSDMFNPEVTDLTDRLNDDYSRMRVIELQSLREIDTLTGVIAGYLSVLIDECMENYTPQLKVWIRIKLSRLDDLRKIKVLGEDRFLSFPVAVATLTPYLIKTRVNPDELGKFASIRNRIRSLSRPLR